MRSLLVPAVVAACLGGGGATAQPVPAYGWTGFYAGIGGGFGAANDDLDNFIAGFIFEDHVEGLGADGPLIEGTVGADLQLGADFVVGALADVCTGLTPII